MKKLYLLLLLAVFFADNAFALVSFTGNVPIFVQHLAFTPSFTTNTFSITSGKTYFMVLSCAVWQNNDIITVTTPGGSVLTWNVIRAVDSSLTVGDTATYYATAASSNATESATLTESSVGFFHYCDVKVYEVNGFTGVGASGQATSNVGGGPAPSLTYTPSTTGSFLFESASNDAHPLTAQPEWTLTTSTSADAFIMDGDMDLVTTSTASRVIAPGNSGGTNGFSMQVVEFLNTASSATTTLQDYALKVLGTLVIKGTLIIK